MKKTNLLPDDFMKAEGAKFVRSVMGMMFNPTKSVYKVSAYLALRLRSIYAALYLPDEDDDERDEAFDIDFIKAHQSLLEAADATPLKPLTVEDIAEAKVYMLAIGSALDGYYDGKNEVSDILALRETFKSLYVILSFGGDVFAQAWDDFCDSLETETAETN